MTNFFGTPPATGLPAWLADCQFRRKEPISNIANALLGLSRDPDFQTAFRFDEMLRVATIVLAIPGVVEHGPFPRIVDDYFVTATQIALQRKGLRSLASGTVLDAITRHARLHAHHPVRDALSAAFWDGQPRVASWLATYLGAAANDYHATVGSCFLIAMVARVYRPGCKCDYMLVLEGPQGELKSTAVNILAGGYFGDDMPDLDSDPVRVSQYLRGKWIIEVPELSAFSRAEATRLKSFISRQAERYIPKFGRLEAIEPRQNVLIGTTNQHAYLRDETGGRRFWPVVCSNIDLDALARDRDQLLAEAAYLYHAGNQWWPERTFERQFIAPIQESRYEGDAWEDMISDYLTNDAIGSTTHSVTVTDVAHKALQLDGARIGTRDQRRISAALQHLGWHRGSRLAKGWCWERP